MKRTKAKRLLLGAMLAVVMLPLVGCIIERDRDHYYHDYDGQYYHRR